MTTYRSDVPSLYQRKGDAVVDVFRAAVSAARSHILSVCGHDLSAAFTPHRLSADRLNGNIPDVKRKTAAGTFIVVRIDKLTAHFAKYPCAQSAARATVCGMFVIIVSASSACHTGIAPFLVSAACRENCPSDTPSIMFFKC